MKKTTGMILAAALLIVSATGCSTAGDQTKSGFDTSQNITVVSREEGSGTRSAFIELFGVEQKDAAGNKVDSTTEEASITNSTSVMMTTVAGNKYSIGYISLGSLNDTVKALKIDGAEPTVARIKDGSYKISRPFNIVTKGDAKEVAKDFIKFILSADGQKVIETNGYIRVSEAPAFDGGQAGGKIVVAGSSSVTPVMEKLREAYLAINPKVTIEIQQSDSTTGMTSTIEGICDIGMASRELKASEIEKGLSPTVIALDGIAVIVNQGNPTDDLSSEQVQQIFTGKASVWADL